MLLRLSCSVCCARALEGLVRAESLAFGRPRAIEREVLESDKWGASDDRGQRAALTLAAPPLPRTALPPPSPRHARRAAPLFMIASELKLAILYQGTTTNNNSFYIARHFNLVQLQFFLQTFQLKSDVVIEVMKFL